MKRDDWILGNGVKAGDEALLDGTTRCHVLKVKGSRVSPDQKGNVLIELLEGMQEGEQIVVLGGRIAPIKY